MYFQGRPSQTRQMHNYIGDAQSYQRLRSPKDEQKTSIPI